MNFRHLRTFVVVAEAGGVARASARLNLSQPAASRQIQALESELGVSLFDRIGRRIQLTSEGEDLLRHSRRLLSEADSLAARAGALKKGETGILRVGAAPQVIENTLAAFLTRYQRRHPGIGVRLVEDGGTRQAIRLDRGDVHLSIMAAHHERFQSRPLYPVYCLAVLSNEHRLSRSRTLEVSELANEPLLLLGAGFGTRTWFDAACSVAHIRPRVLLESGAPHTIMALAREGYGIAVISSSIVVPRERVRAVPLVQRGAVIGDWMRITWDSGRFLARYAEQFVDELEVHCRSNYPGRELIRRAPPLPRPKEPSG